MKRNYYMEHLLSASCPTCGAKAGERCIKPPGYYPIHWARLNATPLSRFYTLKIRKVYAPGCHATAACRNNNHKWCKGRVQRNHGLEFRQCSCTCHKTTLTGKDKTNEQGKTRFIDQADQPTGSTER